MLSEFKTIEDIESLVISVPDFPKPGINFKDITPILENAQAFKALTQIFSQEVPEQTTKIVGIESRGFIFGAALANHANIGLVLVRKPGKLPRETFSHSYELEYGSDTLELHKDALKPEDKVVIIDDVLATGGTASAVEKLCESTGAQVLGHCFLMEIEALNGRSKLEHKATSFIKC